MQSDQDQTQKKLGRGFWYATWICVLLLLVTFFDSELQQQYNPNADVEYQNQNGVATVILKRNRAGHYVANGFINNHPVTFLLDTGATNVAIPARIADNIGLIRGQEHYTTTANGQSIGYSTRLDSLELGAILLHDVKASIAPGFKANEILLGMSALKQLEFTQRGDTLTLKLY